MWVLRSLNLQILTDYAEAKSAEEMTAKRRAERKQFKSDRAAAIAAAALDAEVAFVEGRTVESNIVIPSAATWKPSDRTREVDIQALTPKAKAKEEDDEAEVDEDDYRNLEHLQLTLQESFFLVWALKCLRIRKLKDV